MGKKRTRPCTVYAIQCTKNQKIYVGCTENFKQRIRRHFYDLGRDEKRATAWQEDYRRYGMDAFHVFVLEADIDPEKASQVEHYWINFYDSTDPRFGYNIYGRALIPGCKIHPGLPKKRGDPACRAKS